MRITGGMAGGASLKVPKGYKVRPTPDRVRQALFNSLGTRVMGARVLELFGGTGALSLECLSRGAISALCVEWDELHARFILENLRNSKLPSGALHVRVQDVFAALRQIARAGENFDIVLADPPYGEKNTSERSKSLAQKLLDEPALREVIKPSGLFILGHARRDRLEIPQAWQVRKVLEHGDSVIRFLELLEYEKQNA